MHDNKIHKSDWGSIGQSHIIGQCPMDTWQSISIRAGYGSVHIFFSFDSEISSNFPALIQKTSSWVWYFQQQNQSLVWILSFVEAEEKFKDWKKKRFFTFKVYFCDIILPSCYSIYKLYKKRTFECWLLKYVYRGLRGPLHGARGRLGAFGLMH